MLFVGARHDVDLDSHTALGFLQNWPPDNINAININNDKQVYFNFRVDV